MTLDGSEGLCTDVLLWKEFPVVCVVGSGGAGAGAYNLHRETIHCAHSFTSFFCHFYPLHLLTERKYV